MRQLARKRTTIVSDYMTASIVSSEDSTSQERTLAGLDTLVPRVTKL